MGKLRTKLPLLALLGVTASLLAGCPAREDIAKINRDPARYSGKEIAIAGRVIDSFGAFGSGVYEVDDGTGTMWVFSDRYGTPAAEAKVAVVGRVEQGFGVGGRSFLTILRETQRRH